MTGRTRLTLNRGDVVWVQLNPTRGHEQAGLRPAVVISSRPYNERSSLVLVCAMTTKRRKWAFSVPVTFKGKAAAVLVDQIRSIDQEARITSVAGQLTKSELGNVMGMLDALVFQ